MKRAFVFGLILAALGASAAPASITFKKSSLVFRPPTKAVVRSGETFTVELEYDLDPSENLGGGTSIQLMPLGPWIDNPDGVYTTKRFHSGVVGLRNQRQKVAPGKGVATFSFTPSAIRPRDGLFFRATFIGGDGKEWPWEVRGGGITLVPDVKGFSVSSPASGGLFAVGEKPVVRILWGGEKAGTTVSAAFSLLDCSGHEVVAFTHGLTAGAAGSSSDVALPPFAARGVFLVRVTIGAEVREGFIGVIPDVAEALGGKRAPFGCTNVHTPEEAAAAAKLGFAYCRLFTSWSSLEPRRGDWHFAELDAQIATLRAAGLRPWILLGGAPEWAMPAACHRPGFEPFPFDAAGWGASARHLAEHYKGRIFGFEWLNEIVPGGKSSEPVADYARFCATGTKAVRAVDPSMRIQLAGGLWPRNFRLDCIRAGVLSSVDILPVHYSSYDGVREAIADAAGASVEVWDNESARGYSIWNDMPGIHALTNSVLQSRWVMRQWPGELVAGAKGLVYFGGDAQAPGNWTYLLDQHTPRPVAATLAVLAAKLGAARPVGAVHLDPGAVAYLFQRPDGRGLAVVMSASETDSCAAKIPVGSSPVTGHQPQATGQLLLTDHQGNESPLAVTAGFATLAAAPMPVILEGFDPAPLAAAASLTVAGRDALAPCPSVRVVAGAEIRVPVGVSNPLSVPVVGTVSLVVGGHAAGSQSFGLAPGATRFLNFSCGQATAAVDATASLVWSSPAATATRSFRVEVVQPELLGNLLKNGGFETPGNKPGRIAEWSGKGFDRVALGGGAPGLEGFALESSRSKGYVHVGQRVAFPVRGLTYLYTAWMWAEDGGVGSNIYIEHDNGKNQTLTMPRVFSAPKSTKGWVFMAKRLATEPDMGAATFSPVAITPSGRARCDNVRVTVFDGTDYATEAFRARKGIKADADLSDWDLSNPVPLLCENQVTGTGGYSWSPANLSGEAWFAWDKDALYFAARVRDDVHVAKTGDAAPDGDALTLALHPANRVPGTDGQALEWYISSANPGGGSGACTLYRPAAHCAGLKSGQLAKDSSTYEIAVKTVGDITTYELRIPWPEVGGFVPELGAKLGLSLRLTDADNGPARGAAAWGMGLAPAWAPTAFGVLTLVK